jgi:hypothetical protein
MSRCRTEEKGNTARGRHNYRQASVFKQSSHNLCVIKLIDKHGNVSCEVQEGRLNKISHQSILRALEHWAKQFKCKEKVRCVDDNLVSWARDETGTIDSTLLSNRTEMNEHVALVELQEKVRVEELGISKEILKIHGVAPATKGEGIIRLIYENANGFSNRLSDNKKIDKLRRFTTNSTWTLRPTASIGST